MNRMDDEFTYNLNELIDYHLVAIGYKGESFGIYTMEDIQGGNHTFSLEAKSLMDVDTILSKFSKNNLIPNLKEELDYLKIEAREQIRSKAFILNETLRRNILPYVFPCLSETMTEKRKGSIEIERTN
jgi:hypothetical protein